jgi:hypothetical protein
MADAAERMKAMRIRRRAGGLRELRIVVPDARQQAVRQRTARAVKALHQGDEQDALAWIEIVSEFDAPEPGGADEAG